VFTPALLERLADRCARDAEYRVAARNTSLQMGVLCDGDETVVWLGPNGMDWRKRTAALQPGWPVALASSLEIWRRFLRPVPPPLHHDLFALLSRVPEFRLLGDPLPLMQNARVVQRWATLLRATAVEGARA
jgi:hypothetical protein